MNETSQSVRAPLIRDRYTLEDGPSVSQIARPQVIATTESTDAGQAKGIDKSILAVAAPHRYPNRRHLRYVAQQAGLICGRKQSDPHHLRYLQPRAQLFLRASYISCPKKRN